MFYKDEDTALTILRIAIGIIFIAHSMLKFAVFGFTGSGQWFTMLGVWSFLVYPVTIIEFMGGVALVIGFYARQAALLLLPVTAGILWVHRNNGWTFNSTNGGWEYPALLIVCLLVIVVGGSGRLSMTRD
jgi:putative oxidoreductase